MRCSPIKVGVCLYASENNAQVFAGAGAGQSLEDGYILGRALADYLAQPCDQKCEQQLARYMKLYQAVRLPRAKRAQQTAREAGSVYEMQHPDFEDRVYDDCLPLVADKLRDRMKWIWSGDIDAEFEETRRCSINRGVLHLVSPASA
jgi:salicylate hydroxylase